MPTACEMVDIKIPPSVQGKSLVPILQNPNIKVKKSALSFVRKGKSLRNEKWAYMKYSDGSEELYDMKNDPKQFKNLASIDSKSKVIKMLRKQFKSRINLN